MRWRHLCLGAAVHLISRLRRQLPLIGEAFGVRKSKAGSPFRGGGMAIAVTERSYQICGNLSVTFGDSSPGRGAKGPLRRGKKGAAGGSPFSISYQYVRITALTLPKICASLPSIG